MEQVDKIKYLGIIEDPALTYKFHFEELEKKTKKKINSLFFMQAKDIPINIKMKAFKAYI